MITNTTDISLALAVWLIQDNYDYVSDEDYISATGLMAPLRHIVLRGRPALNSSVSVAPDVSEFVPRALGNSLHSAIEHAWTHGHKQALASMGYPKGVIENITINPSDEFLKANPNTIPIFLEQRVIRQMGKYKIGGKFDMVTDGILQDTKSTSTYVWVLGDSRTSQYQLQGSIYRWLDQSLPIPRITSDFIRVNFIFTDWSKAEARYNSKYPQKRVEYKDVSLLSVSDTEAWIRQKLALVEKYKSAPEKEIPECSDEELWKGDSTYKYYGDPNKTSGRSTKNFDNDADAQNFLREKNKGVVVLVPGEPKRCNYCPVFNSCSQKDRYFSA